MLLKIMHQNMLQNINRHHKLNINRNLYSSKGEKTTYIFTLIFSEYILCILFKYLMLCFLSHFHPKAKSEVYNPSSPHCDLCLFYHFITIVED